MGFFFYLLILSPRLHPYFTPLLDESQEEMHWPDDFF
jgi:hypothetical protein